MEPPLMLSVLGAPVDLLVGGSRGAQARAALAERWSLCLRGPATPPAARTVEVRLGDEEAAGDVSDADPPAVSGTDLDRLLVDVTHRVTREAIDAGAGSLLMFHAAALADPGSRRAVVCVAPGGTGKTTLCRTLGPGRAYLTDETVGVTAEGTVLPYAKPLSVRRSDGDPAGPKDEVDPGDVGLVGATTSPSVVAVLLLAREPQGPDDAVVEDLDLFDAIVALTPETSSLARLPRPLHRLADLLGSVDVLARVHYREAASLEPVLASVIGGPR